MEPRFKSRIIDLSNFGGYFGLILENYFNFRRRAANRDHDRQRQRQRHDRQRRRQRQRERRDHNRQKAGSLFGPPFAIAWWVSALALHPHSDFKRKVK